MPDVGSWPRLHTRNVLREAARLPAGNGRWDDSRSMSTRMTSARFVGRSGQLAELEAALHDADERRPSLALIAGDSGVGKSRLVEELTRRARASGARVLSGDSVELGEGELPYAPLLGALRHLVRERDHSPALRSALASILPGLDEHGRRDGSGATQSYVFEALLALLE